MFTGFLFFVEMMVATRSRDFSSLPFDGIPPHSSPYPFSADFSWQLINRQSRISRFLPLRATKFLRWFSLGFVTPDPVPLTSSVVLRLRSASVVFVVVTPLRPTGHYCPISLLFHSSPSSHSVAPAIQTTEVTIAEMRAAADSVRLGWQQWRALVWRYRVRNIRA